MPAPLDGLPCVAQLRDVPPQDVAVVAVKAHDLAPLASALAGLLKPGGRIVFATNGIPWWFGLTPGLRLLDALQAVLDPGEALSRRGDPTLERFAALLGTAGLDARVSDDIRPAEGLAIGRALGLPVQEDVAARLCFYRGKPVRPSMLQDAEAGRALEIDGGILAFARVAERSGRSGGQCRG